MKNSPLGLSQAAPAPLLMRAESWAKSAERQSVSTDRSKSILPGREQWRELLGLEEVGAVEKILRRALLDPIAELNSAQGKRIRGQLVAFSFRLLGGDKAASAFAKERCRLAAEAVEFIHAGSLIVDDIEDGSTVRRGRPALHLRYPMPIALNAGNWLYFWPFDLMKQLALPNDHLLHIYESCHRTLLRAHFGQAIDLGAKIDGMDQRQVTEICMASIRLKTGALMGFAALLGAAAAGVSDAFLTILDDFGRDLGVALQMFDDLGNVLENCQPAKRYEDLMLSRPSWVWACAAENCQPADYQKFVTAIQRLPDDGALKSWMEDHDIICRTRSSARNYLDLSFAALEKRLSARGARWSRHALNELRDLGEEIAVAYG
jgi:geranylgeranyl pyrophosphate synthase